MLYTENTHYTGYIPAITSIVSMVSRCFMRWLSRNCEVQVSKIPWRDLPYWDDPHIRRAPTPSLLRSLGQTTNRSDRLLELNRRVSHGLVEKDLNSYHPDEKVGGHELRFNLSRLKLIKTPVKVKKRVQWNQTSSVWNLPCGNLT
jgi:hypothetical protein